MIIQNYISKDIYIAELEKRLALIDDKLKSPQRTVDDLIGHMQILKELRSLKDL